MAWRRRSRYCRAGQITGAEFVIRTNTEAPERAILVGPGAAAQRAFAGVPFDTLGAEELVIKTEGQRLLLAGGHPRGTLYAMSRFLQDQCGVRWWTSWASRIPRKETLRLDELDVRAKPAFEYRESFWYPAFNADWSWRNSCNGHASRLTPDKGRLISYKGFVHTFYALVPPEKHFADHPEWFSLIKGKRTTDRAQLCLTNPKLRDFMVERVKAWLRESPDAGIISVSQNDWHGACECPDCKVLDDAEGTHAAAPAIARDLEFLHDASRGHNLTCYSGTDAPFMRFKPLAAAEKFWQEAENAVVGDDELLTRVRIGHLPVCYVWLSRWDKLRKECADAGATWPMPDSRKKVADDWMSVAKGSDGKPWTKVTLLNEGGLTPEKWPARFATDPAGTTRP